MNLQSLLFTFLALFLSAALAQTEPPQFMTIDGRLYDSTNPEDPLLDGSVILKIQILNPAKTCILYEESQTVSTLSSNGYFNVRVGSPTSGMESLKRAALDSGNSMSLVFQNQAVATNGKTSAGLGCGYTPSSGDSRFFRFIVTPSTTGLTSTLSPDMSIDSVPQSLVAETLQGFVSDDFLQISANVTQAKAESLFGSSYSTLTSLLGGTSSLYLRNTTNGTVIPSRPSDPATPSAGQIWYDSVTNELKFYNGTATQTVGTGTGVDPTKLPLAGGTMLGVINMGSFDITSAGHITQSAQRTLRFGGYTSGQEGALIATPLTAGQEGTAWYNATTDKLMYWDGVAAQEVLTSTSANSLVPNCAATQSLQMSTGPIYVWSCVNTTDSTKLALAGGTMTGAFVTTSSVTLNAQNQTRYADADSSNFAALQSPATIAANYVLTLPVDDGNSGQYLQTDGNGVLSWVTPAGVGETNTASNVTGSLGVGLFKQKSTYDLEFKSLLAGSNKLSVIGGASDVTLDVVESNFNLATIPNTAAGNIAATTAQAALNELDTEKVAKSGDTMTGALVLGPKGVVAGDGGSVQLMELAANGVNTAAIRSPDALAANYVLTLPIDDGSPGQVLQTDGSGVLSWVSPASSIADDSLNFDKLSDTMALDASTDIAVTGTNVLSITNSGTGNSLVVNDQSTDTTPFVIDGSGNVGIGTSSPSDSLEIIGAANGSGSGHIIVQNTTNGSSAHSSIFLKNSANVAMEAGIASGLYTINTGIPGGAGYLKTSSSSGLSILSGHASTSAIRFYTAGLDAANEKMRIDHTGKVGIGTTVPTDKLVVDGAIRNLSAIDRTSLTTIDFSGGNIQYTTNNCTAFALHNVRSGGSYTFVVQGTVSQTCSFTAFSDTGSTALTVHMPADHGPTTVGKHTIYTAIVAGTHIYFAWTPDM